MTVKRIINWLAALALLVLLQACSAIKLAYNNAPDFAYWWLDGYLDFQSEQTPRVRDELGKLLAWHRSEELPRFASLLQKAQRLAAGDITPAQACAVYGEARERFHAIARQLEAPAAALADGLAADQLKHLEAKFAKVNADHQREWGRLTPSGQLERRLKMAVERAEEFYGGLDGSQVHALRGMLEMSIYNPVLNDAERQRRQQDWLQTLRRLSGTDGGPKPASAQAQGLLRAYVGRMDHSPDPAYETYNRRLVLEGCGSFAFLHNSASSEQRERAVRRLAAYERDVRELHAQR
jgi:uncharacterized protein YukE